MFLNKTIVLNFLTLIEAKRIRVSLSKFSVMSFRTFRVFTIPRDFLCKLLKEYLIRRCNGVGLVYHIGKNNQGKTTQVPA